MAKKRIIKRRKKGKSRKYFTKDTQAAIYEFCATKNIEEKEEVYLSRIQPAVSKLAENLIFIYGFHKDGTCPNLLKHDCVVFLYETLHKFDHTRGTNAFSYFNVVAKNWLIINSRRNKKRKERHVSLDATLETMSRDASKIAQSQIVPPPDHHMIDKEKSEMIVSMLHEIKNRLSNKYDLACIDAIIVIFSKLNQLDYLNKRAIFVYVRDLSGLKPKQLSLCMANIRKHYRELVGPDKKFDIF